jgi:hypothetical protein
VSHAATADTSTLRLGAASGPRARALSSVGANGSDGHGSLERFVPSPGMPMTAAIRGHFAVDRIRLDAAFDPCRLPAALRHARRRRSAEVP